MGIYAEGIQGGVSAQTSELLQRPVGGRVHFSDVFPAVGGEQWWQGADFDAGLTVQVETTGSFPDMVQIPIGERPWVTPGGLVLCDDLVRARANRVASFLRSEVDVNTLHPDVQAEIEVASKAVVALANYAPRDDKNTEGGRNGSDFYLAVTDAGTEVVTTPLSFLAGLDARDRITALYRIPTAGHPAFDGEHEQFRSARVERSRQTPDHLVPIFEYGSREELIAAKQAGEHPDVIPSDERSGHFVHFDKFGNGRIELKDITRARALRAGQFLTLLVRDQGAEYALEVVAAANLKSAPLGQLAVYANCADEAHIDADHAGGSTVGYLELIARVNGNPSLAEDSAVRQLLKQIPDLDFATAELELVVGDGERAAA